MPGRVPKRQLQQKTKGKTDDKRQKEFEARKCSQKSKYQEKIEPSDDDVNGCRDSTPDLRNENISFRG